MKKINIGKIINIAGIVDAVILAAVGLVIAMACSFYEAWGWAIFGAFGVVAGFAGVLMGLKYERERREVEE